MKDPAYSLVKELSSTSSALLRMAREGDEAGWARLVNEYAPRVYRWCLRAELQRTDAADVVQEVFAAVSSSLHRFRRDRDGDSFRKWIKTITTNKIRDHWRIRKRTERAIGGSSWQDRVCEVLSEVWESSSSAAVVRIPNDARREAVEQVRANVTARDWAIFERQIVDEQAPQDVAIEFGTTVNVVRLVKSRILKGLRRLVETDANRLVDNE